MLVNLIWHCLRAKNILAKVKGAFALNLAPVVA